MALSAATTWEIRADGSDDNGGGFVTGATGTDRSQQAAPHVTIDGATITATVHTTTTQLNIVGYTVIAGDVGNTFKISGGTATAGYYQITVADTVNNRWTVDRSAGTATQTATGRMGGALASIGQLGDAVNAGVANSHAYIREGTYTLTSSSANVSGGTYSNTSNRTCFISGYSASGGRTSWGAGPTIDVGAITSVTVFDINNANFAGPAIGNVTVDGQGNASIVAFDVSFSGATAAKCTAVDCTTGFTLASSVSVRAIACKATGCTTGFSCGSNALAVRCWADGCTTGFTTFGNGVSFIGCVSSDCGTPYGLNSNTDRCYIGCTADGNTAASGIDVRAGGTQVIDCVSTNNSGGYGVDFVGGTNTLAVNVATYSNTSGGINPAATGQTVQINSLALSADPWVDGATDDYRPNNTAGGGASLRGASLGITGQSNNRDIGALQHADPASGGAGPGSLVGGIHQ